MKIDPRGTWALRFVGATMTGVHRVVPNSGSPDGVVSCTLLRPKYSDAALERMGMECADSPIPSNFAGNSHSQHPGIVNTLRLDGSVHAVCENIDVDLWTRLHSR